MQAAPPDRHCGKLQQESSFRSTRRLNTAFHQTMWEMRMRSGTGPALILLALALSGTPALGDSALSDDFDSDTLDFTAWCPCQINLSKSPYTFEPDPGDGKDRLLSIPVDRHSLGGNKCRAADECVPPGTAVLEAKDLGPRDRSENETLGPTFFDDEGTESLTLDPIQRNPYCDDEAMKEALAANEENECYQRQEIRVQGNKAHPATERYIYEIRFRMPASVADQTNSIRWVIGQWKQDPESARYAAVFGENWGASPFLAQRYDDGVLHVTVQDEHCRCLVASAPHPTRKFDLADGSPKECESTHPANEGAACSSGLSLKFGPKPALESPAGQFVDMKYVVQAGRDSPARIDIFQNGRPIVTVSGKIGYDVDAASPAATKFKIGHYRDYMPHDYVMDIDRIAVEKETAQ
jgi:hypothetical protein